MNTVVNISNEGKTEDLESVKRPVIYPEEEEKAEESESSIDIDALLILSTVTVWAFRLLFERALGNLFFYIVGWGNLGYLVYSTIRRLFLKSEESRDKGLDVSDIMAIMCLLLHLFMFTLLVCNSFVFSGSIGNIADVIIRNPLGILMASRNFLDSQQMMESQRAYYVSLTVVQMAFAIVLAVTFDYGNDAVAPLELLRALLLLMLVGTTFCYIEDVVIRNLKISKEKVKRFRLLAKMMLVIGCTTAGYYMMDRMFKLATTEMASTVPTPTAPRYPLASTVPPYTLLDGEYC
ncbi:hypothetical protein [Encephalitozoon cuniculi GB-M1]|uniref:Uncharacterized protein ECU05_1600/ECU11_0130 n=1 Tax=Encephalitozoon cuniculi (strain GB-M1) TaxID=284813 RepID=Y5G0_ENCCU|nr:uncharacterized protein ECU11_0130 [Encephalitozoon cuniculi GB-M1]NP_597503.2 uncharacterized protein ECU05_1600 [Encephalitozoon cuniculi GB-M1]Q8STJ2.2 RecName: Full=Uncharacterized protein ECU05_1600/ECU11_0130 [Encephalitozoon cuniculi GB-M1]CAD25923.2 hypothetical protein [Encephalitozoon cuniculi GB-M1]CAD26680.2 hypothetical protein [Encephalitozoon cuniculi GB-M1]